MRNEGARRLKRVTRAIEKVLKRHGFAEHVAVVAPYTQNGTFRIQAFSADEALQKAVDSCLGQINHMYHVYGEVPTYKEFTTPPARPDDLGAATRKLLGVAWAAHTENTAFENKKQMYRIVKDHPDMKFEWWAAVTSDEPFTNKAASNPDVALKIFEYLAPKLYTKVHGGAA